MEEGHDARSNRRRPVRGPGISTHQTAGQDWCDSNTCIANNLLSRRAWNVSLPRFVKRSSPKSNFINLCRRSIELALQYDITPMFHVVVRDPDGHLIELVGPKK